MTVSEADWVRLRATARAAAGYSYSPYSRFPVGAAVLVDTGEVFSGCNVENASLGLTNCAERTAVFKAVSAGARRVLALVVFTPTDKATPPCGACRQVLNEFGPDALIESICNSDDRLRTALSELLPGAFGPGNLA